MQTTGSFVPSLVGPSDTFIKLASRPSQPVYVSIGSAGTVFGGVTSVASPITIAPANWATPAPVSIDLTRLTLDTKVGLAGGVLAALLSGCCVLGVRSGRWAI